MSSCCGEIQQGRKAASLSDTCMPPHVVRPPPSVRQGGGGGGMVLGVEPAVAHAAVPQRTTLRMERKKGAKRGMRYGAAF